MFGKKSGLDLGLRSLLAKISKEFDFPKVVKVRCRVDTQVAAVHEPFKVVLRMLELPHTEIQSCALQLNTQVQSEALGMATCHQMQPLESLTTKVVAVPCYGAKFAKVIAPTLVVQAAKIVTPQFSVALPSLKSPFEQIELPSLKDTPLRMGARVRGGPMLARSLPFYLPVTSMRDLGVKLTLRYRAAVIRQLGRDPRQVKFLGVVTNLPKAPLSILKYEEGTRDGADQVLTRVRGERNLHMGRRAWVLVRVQGNDDVLPITVKEEEA